MHHDAIVVGGSFAGLSAAIYIARGRRSVRVIDAGLPRNRFATESHGFFGHDGSAPGAMIEKARAQVAAYPSARITDGKVTSAKKRDDAFEVTLESGETLAASRLVLAYGISDILPDLAGLKERWGHSVIHCPYCHGFEYGGRKLGVIYSGPMSLHQAQLITEWGPTTLFLNGQRPDPEQLAALIDRRVQIERAPLQALVGEGRAISGVVLEDGRQVELNALFLAPQNRLNSDLAEQLGCAIQETPLGQIIQTNAMKETTVPGVFAAGDIARGAQNATWASSDGVMAGSAVHRSFVF